MAVKLVVIYPRPKDVEAFETVYNRDHVPMAVAKLAGKTKIVATRVLGSPAGEPPFHRVAEGCFRSMEALNNAPRRKVANRRLGMQFRFRQAAHRSFWSHRRERLYFEC